MGWSLFYVFAELVSSALEPSLYVCAHCSCKVYKGGYREIIDGKEKIFCRMYCARAYQERKKLAKKTVQK